MVGEERLFGENVSFLIHIDGQRYFIDPITDFSDKKNSERKTHESIGKVTKDHTILYGDFEITGKCEMVGSDVSRLQEYLEEIQLQGRAMPKGTVTIIETDREGFGQEVTIYYKCTIDIHTKTRPGSKEVISYDFHIMSNERRVDEYISVKNPNIQ